MKNIHLIGFIIFFLSANSQNNIKISGVILDSMNKEPVYGAHIYPDDYPTGTFSDDKGSFILQLPYSLRNDTIHISCIGFETLRLKISDINSEQFFLKEKLNELNEVNIVSKYSPRKILKKALKQIKFNYPYKESFCSKAYFREYLKKDSETIHFLELVVSIADSGIAYDSYKNTQVNVDSVYSLILNDHSYNYWSNSMFWTWSARDDFYRYPLKKMTYFIDSITYINNDKILHITYIPPKSKEITYEKSSINIYDDEIDTVITYYDSTLQYNRRFHFVVNMSNYAILDFSDFYIKLSEPNRNNIFEDKYIHTDYYLKISFFRHNDKYYPKNIIMKDKMDVYESKKYKKISYKTSTFNEIYVKYIDDNCEKSKNYTPQLLDKDEFERLYKPILIDSIEIKQFDDMTREYYYSKIKD